MSSNPFLSNTYYNTWLKHFGSDRDVVTLSLFPELRFQKHSFLGFYYNLGRTITKAVSYHLRTTSKANLKGEVYLIYDYPRISKEAVTSGIKGVGLHTIPQYLGYRADLSGYESAHAYLEEIISKKSRLKFNSYKRKLEKDFQITYNIYDSNSKSSKIESLMESLRVLLEKRFRKKRVDNNNLSSKEWAFHKEVSIKLIKEGKAGLFVIENGDKPIAINLMYFSTGIVYDVMRVFDIDYSKYRPGTISILRQIEWCFNNDYKILDFSKGHFEYKQRWSNTRYIFENHIFFDQRSLKAIIIAFFILIFYLLKNVLREIRLDELWIKVKFYLVSKRSV